MMLAGFTQHITFLSTHDLDLSARFYERALGLVLWRDQGDCRIYQIRGDAYIGICLRTGTTGLGQGVILCLVSEDVDGWAESLKAMGYSLECEPTYHPTYQIYHFFLRDPSGYLIEIQRFED